jgi:hypothetical protein
VALIKEFFIELDRHWKQTQEQRIPLRVIGSAALMLHTEYERRTKDSDVIETDFITEPVRKALLDIAGKKTEFHSRYGMYLDIVPRATPFLPHPPSYRTVDSLKGLRNFAVDALDTVDVAVSKLKRFNASDADDVAAMVNMGAVGHEQFIDRLKSAVDGYSLDARAEDLPKVIANFHTVERDCYQAPETEIPLPDWMQD